MRRYREHLLSEPEEKILSEKSLTGASAWTRLFEELTSAIEVELRSAGSKGAAATAGDGGVNGGAARVALDVALSRLALPDREVRRTAAEAVTAALAPGLRTRAYVLNTLLADKSVDDRLRRYPNWLAARNLANEASDESVQALIEAVRGRYELARRWYRLKAGLLGIERLADYDRMAAVTQDEVSFTYAQARELVLDCYSSFSPELGELAGRFFAERWIDAPVRPAKRGGAFCASAVPSAHPYVLLNYTARRRDVLTLAHELGHGVHFALAARQGIFHQGTPLTLAETASVFGETVVFGRLLAQDTTPQSRLALLAEHLEDIIATVFRQVAMNRFEELVHTGRREQGELSVERIGELWSAEPGASCSATRWRSPTGIAAGGRTSPTSSTPPATCTPTPTASCWRCRCTSATRSAARTSCRNTWSCSPRAARAAPRSSGGSSMSTSPTPASGMRASTWSSASWSWPKRRLGLRRASTDRSGAGSRAVDRGRVIVSRALAFDRDADACAGAALAPSLVAAQPAQPLNYMALAEQGLGRAPGLALGGLVLRVPALHGRLPAADDLG